MATQERQLKQQLDDARRKHRVGKGHTGFVQQRRQEDGARNQHNIEYDRGEGRHSKLAVGIQGCRPRMRSVTRKAGRGM